MAPKITAVLIAKNEAKLIGRCIRSLGPVDEIVVYDTGSTDDTVGVAERAGAKVFRGEIVEPFHFAEARNLATAKAQNPWILSIDADEVLRAGSLSKIRAALKIQGEETAWRVGFINRSATGTLSIPILKIKLFMKDAWTWKYRVHERLTPLLAGKIGDMDKVVIDHMPEPDKGRRHGQNIKLLELCVKENPEYTKAFKHLGLELMLDKRPAEAIPYFCYYIDNTDDDRFKKSRAMDHAGNCLETLGQLDDALEMFERSAKVAPERRDPLYHAAIALIKACRLDEAVTWIKRMIVVPFETRPNLPYDLPALWRSEPQRMLRFCEDQIRIAQSALEARKKV